MAFNTSLIRRILSLALAGASLCTSTIARADPALSTASPSRVSGTTFSAQMQALVTWTVRTDDNRGRPFLIVDKVAARLFLFDRHGTLQVASPVLLGRGRGDVSPPGIGDRKLSQITPAERITPAGRFVASGGRDLAGKDIVWVDYGAAVAIHRATDLTPGATAQDRLVRLASGSPSERRVSFGCINVSDAFYDAHIRPAFNAGSGIVYILPETVPFAALFPVAATRVQR
jgi:hypothetical protein